MIQRIGCKVTGSLLLHSFVNCRDGTLLKCWSPSYSFRACNKTIWLRSVRQRHSRMIAVHSPLLSSPIHHFLCTQVTPIMRHKMRRHKWDSDIGHWFWPGVCPETKKVKFTLTTYQGVNTEKQDISTSTKIWQKNMKWLTHDNTDAVKLWAYNMILWKIGWNKFYA